MWTMFESIWHKFRVTYFNLEFPAWKSHEPLSRARAVPWTRLILSGLSLRSSGLNPWPLRVGFFLDKMAVRQVFLDQALRSCTLSTIPLIFRTHSLTSPTQNNLSGGECRYVTHHPRVTQIKNDVIPTLLPPAFVAWAGTTVCFCCLKT
jgi:hypothetical protein